MKIETKRLILRQVKMKDVPALVENINNLNVSRWLLVVPYPYKKKDGIWYVKNVAEKMKKKPREDYPFSIELKSEKRIIGGIGMHKVNMFSRTAEVGYWLGEKYWRFGYGSEALEALIDFAFKKLKLRRLQAGVFAGNPSSGKLLEKFGFIYEGTWRQSQRSKADGKIKDECWYGLLKSEYNNPNKVRGKNGIS